MLKVIDFVTLIIAVTALIISIVCMNKKCDNFGDTVCGVPGKLGEGESCISTPAGCGINGSEKMYCGEKLTCGYDGKCKSGESTEKCTGKDKSLCPGSGPSPVTNRCSFIEEERGNVICNKKECPVCGEGCNKFSKNGTTVCGIISENPNPYQIELDRACSNPMSDHDRINCGDILNATQSQKDQACKNLCGGSSKCINGNCTMS